MKNRALTYRQFINEAYLDDSGELHDFDAPTGDEYDHQILDHAQRIQEYLEESGAKHVKLRVDDPYILFSFKYRHHSYRMNIDLDSQTTLIVLTGGQHNAAYPIFNDSTDTLFDLLASTGLEFLNT